jgi:hypothetical protein
MATRPITPISQKQIAHKHKVDLTRTSKLQLIDFEELMGTARNEQERDTISQMLRGALSHRYQPLGNDPPPGPGPITRLYNFSPETLAALNNLFKAIQSYPYTVNVENYYFTGFNVIWNYHLWSGEFGQEEQSNVGTESVATFKHLYWLNMQSYSLYVYTGIDVTDPDKHLIWDSGEMLVSDIIADEQQNGLYNRVSDTWGVNRAVGFQVG